MKELRKDNGIAWVLTCWAVQGEKSKPRHHPLDPRLALTYRTEPGSWCGIIDEAKQVPMWCMVCAGLIIKKAYRCKQCVGVRRVVEGGQPVICLIDLCPHCFRKATEGPHRQLTALHHDLGHGFQVFNIEDDSR
ncbi:hypothetical protein J7T55_000832 [Diaporthe amygdali]|uniref:uncharacterized protein n=1 Tax=Phomopsis amygdali TaxID=1214568 RepID=UPI0022FEE03C|nr:uncharacterized protein J7T55_000832 [Diaporthe amygdali]KAJ0119982.1 hypothetical protein J7T55_000832 [Diaporthe amygdali]